MNEYNVIAGVYDKINSGVDYEKWATFTESLFDKYLTEENICKIREHFAEISY